MWMWLRYVIFNILSYTSYRHYKLIEDLTDFIGVIQIKGKISSIALPLHVDSISQIAIYWCHFLVALISIRRNLYQLKNNPLKTIIDLHSIIRNNSNIYLYQTFSKKKEFVIVEADKFLCVWKFIHSAYQNQFYNFQNMLVLSDELMNEIHPLHISNILLSLLSIPVAILVLCPRFHLFLGMFIHLLEMNEVYGNNFSMHIFSIVRQQASYVICYF